MTLSMTSGDLTIRRTTSDVADTSDQPSRPSGSSGPTTLTGAHCPDCGRSTDDLDEVVSSHRTSQGVISYQRCQCGRLHVRLRRPSISA